MNRIRFQDLTPDVYYNQSRDFQFIGRLFDIVLNSAKLNTENLYNLPLNEYTDERLIDLMTMTLGFKSKHSYNVKQLTSLCSAFSLVIKNKGNIKSIILAVRALLNAEGISADLEYKLEEDNTVLTLFVPEKLSDINLLRDLLDYILPAGMSCNITRQLLKKVDTATTEISVDNYINITNVQQDMNDTSIVPEISTDLANAKAGTIPGIIANSEVLQIEAEENK